MASIDELKIAGQNSIDELKTTTSSVDELHVKPYSEYFGEMELTNQEVEKRIDTAEELEMAFLLLFMLLSTYQNKGIRVDKEELTILLTERIKKALYEVNIDLLKGYNYLTDTISTIAKQVVDTTLRNISNKFFLSTDRAKLLAEENSNSIHNEIQFHNAVAKGCTEKKWVTMKDYKVRHTHVKVDDTKIGINEKFIVGDDLMMFPRDTTASYKEIANCRCVLKYLKSGKEVN